ncbi:GNAT family N-acetyltransferase [Pseudomonas sp. RIT-PI-S]|uniref:GNAT family N-acetyltransferase n=1 Tax=Pseudomonas sp. RIT-PI-S TaxID=3035295 RepID=UPI0021DA1282|nr:GNAT family N-acetyltransferase [Pseudomonas sp. RIT-PI-S]
MHLRIEIKKDPQPADYEAILLPLQAYNNAQAEPSEVEKTAFLVIDEAGVTQGGLWARVAARWLFVELLVVPEAARGQGIGSQLMDSAQTLAQQKGCVGIWLDTFSFQAPDFYRRLGFEVFGELKDYPPGHSRFYMQKRFD